MCRVFKDHIRKKDFQRRGKGNKHQEKHEKKEKEENKSCSLFQFSIGVCITRDLDKYD